MPRFDLLRFLALARDPTPLQRAIGMGKPLSARDTAPVGKNFARFMHPGTGEVVTLSLASRPDGRTILWQLPAAVSEAEAKKFQGWREKSAAQPRK